MHLLPLALAICTLLLACGPAPDSIDASADHPDQLTCPSEIPTGPCSGTITCEYGQSTMCPGMTGPVTTCYCNLGNWTCFDIPYDCWDIPMLDHLSSDDSGSSEDSGPEIHSDLGSSATVDTGSQSAQDVSALSDLPECIWPSMCPHENQCLSDDDCSEGLHCRAILIDGDYYFLCVPDPPEPDAR